MDENKRSARPQGLIAMPIRFRCQHCQQLLGIARRKSGSYVNCPTCHLAVQVPAESAPASVPAVVTAPAPASASALLERDDFDALLRPQMSIAGDLPHYDGPAHRGGPQYSGSGMETGSSGPVVLSPGRATALTVVVILMLAVAFGAGLLVGRFLL